MNFKTFVNEPKLGIFAQSAPNKCHIWYFLNKFLTKHCCCLKYLTPHLQYSRVLENTKGLCEKKHKILRKTQAFWLGIQTFPKSRQNRLWRCVLIGHFKDGYSHLCPNYAYMCPNYAYMCCKFPIYVGGGINGYVGSSQWF